MTAATLPSRRAGIAGTTIAHGVLVVLILVAATRSARQLPPVYEVNLVAAPPAAAGPAKPVAATPPPSKAAAPVIKAKPVVKPPPKKLPVQTKAVETPAPAVKNPVTPLPGVAPSTGQDVVTLHQEGLKFPYPEYLTRIENEILKRWDQSGFRNGLHVSIAFVIVQNGTVPDVSIFIDKSSGNPAFDDRARSAIESASGAKAFGPLPTGFNSASLPILFNFTMVPKGTL